MSTASLRAIPGGRNDDDWAGATDLQMIEATSAAVSLFSAKWKVDLLFLLAAGIRRHGRLLDHLLVSKKVLSDALRALERDGLVRRSVFGETPVRVEYSLTPLGRSLTAPLYALWEWADVNFETVLASRREFDLRNASVPSLQDEAPRFSAAFQVRRQIAS
jgi:DNA-binding HxlR family transcriptional regulator